jgi:DNA sulfur modification protein DndD
MILHKLEMYNFRQYIGKQNVEFSADPEKNVTVLIGVNTSGKTTIVRAFEWCTTLQLLIKISHTGHFDV